jgi:hypothetical protein
MNCKYMSAMCPCLSYHTKHIETLNLYQVIESFTSDCHRVTELSYQELCLQIVQCLFASEKLTSLRNKCYSVSSSRIVNEQFDPNMVSWVASSDAM